MLDIAARTSASGQVFLFENQGWTPPTIDMPIPEVAARIVDAGFGVEFMLIDYYRTYGQPASQATLERLREISRGASPITVHSAIGRWNLEACLEEIRRAAYVGASVLVVHPRDLTLESDEPAVDDFRRICAFAHDNGITLGLENSGHTGIGPLKMALDIVGAAPLSTGLGIWIDIGHAHRSYTNDGIPPQAFLTEFRDLIVGLHVHDNFGDDDLHLAPGLGNVDWPSVIPAMRGLPENTVVCLEMAAVPEPIGAIRGAREFLLSYAIDAAQSR